MTTPYYFVYPFGTDADDLTDVPTSTSVDGSMSYEQGFTPAYEYDLQTNPAALPIPRGQMNQLFLQITQAAQWIQQYGTPAWITSSDNLGTPFPYPIYARVYYGGVVYENQVADNITTPGADETWAVISGSQDGVQTGMTIIWSAPGSPDGNYLLCDGSAVSRTTYASLNSKLNQTQTGTLTNTDTTITGLSDTSDMYVGMYLEGTGIPSGATISNVVSSTSIEISSAATASGSNVLRFFQYGNGDGSTTFNLPNYQTYVLAGAGGAGVSFGSETVDVVGEFTGDQTYTLPLSAIPNHTHVTPSGAGYITGGATGISYGSSGNQFGQSADTGTITSYTSQTATPLVQPTTLVKYFIKY